MSMKIFGSGSVFPHDPADDIRSSSLAAMVEVPLMWNDEQDDYTVEMTFAEIRSALDSGTVVVIKDNTGKIYQLSEDQSDWIAFTNVNPQTTQVLTSYIGFYPEGDQYYCVISEATEDFSVNHGK